MSRNFEEIVGVDTNTVPIVDITPNELERAKVEVDEIVRNCQTNKYWTYFCEFGGTPLNRSVNYLNSKQSQADNKDEQPKERFSQFKEEKAPAKQEEECDPKKGCDNIDTVQTGHDSEAQEVVGTENQRLPSYEVHNSKEHVEEGLEQAVCKLEDAKFYQCCDLPPAEECQIKEDTNFTTDLLRPLSTQDEKVSREFGGSLADRGGEFTKEPTKELPTREINQNEDPYRRDLAAETEAELLSMKAQAEKSEGWGSNVSNPSETPKLSEAGLSSTSERFNNENLSEKPFTLQGHLTHSQSLTEKTLTASPSKDNVAFKQNTSEKHAMKQKNVSDQAVEKENATLV